jgi:hypothetical protein
MKRLRGVLRCLVRAQPVSAGALGVFVWGVVVAPLVHSVGHRLDHVQGCDDAGSEGHGRRGYGHEHGHDDADGAVDEHGHAHGHVAARHHDHAGKTADGGSGHPSEHEPRRGGHGHGHGHNALEHFGVALTSVPVFLPPKLYRLESALTEIEYESPSLSRRPLDSMRVRGPPDMRPELMG